MDAVIVLIHIQDLAELHETEFSIHIIRRGIDDIRRLLDQMLIPIEMLLELLISNFVFQFFRHEWDGSILDIRILRVIVRHLLQRAGLPIRVDKHIRGPTEEDIDTTICHDLALKPVVELLVILESHRLLITQRNAIGASR